MGIAMKPRGKIDFSLESLEHRAKHQHRNQLDGTQLWMGSLYRWYLLVSVGASHDMKCPHFLIQIWDI